MKKILLFLIVSFALLTTNLKAQISCNANFTPQFLTGASVKFNPVVTNDTPLVHHNWIFGDLSANSTQVSPTHLYSTNGVYTVKHFVYITPNAGTTYCSDSSTQVITIAQAECGNLQSSFTIANTTGLNPLVQYFVNSSLGAVTTDSIRWTFGDGTSANTFNASHTYANYGTYNVCLRIIKRNPNGVLLPNCVSEYCMAVSINPPTPPCNMQAYFASTGDTLTSPSTIQFNNLSSNISSTDIFTWNFGDGTMSNLFAPTHVYTTPGVYTVCLTVTRPSITTIPPCTVQYCKQITILPPTAPCTLSSNFISSAVASSVLTKVFTNTSIGAASTDSIRWTFGDGTSASTYNATHTYANYGVYNVCLRIIKINTAGVLQTNCVSEYCRVDSILAPVVPCNLQSSFAFGTATSPNSLSQYFTNTSIGAAVTDSIRWTFGDGTSASTYNATHTYANYGVYNVCLRIIKRNTAGVLQTNCVSEYCRVDSILAPVVPCNLQANFTINTTSTVNPITQYFTNTSVGAATTDSIRWTFGDGTSASTYNASHTYASAGVYNVCLRIIKRNSAGVLQTNCISEKCRLDTVLVPTTCNFQAYFSTTTTSTSTTAPMAVQFVNQTIGLVSTDVVTWNFGDGTSSTVPTPTHIYTNPGTYTACIRIVRATSAGSTPCIREYCKTIIVTAPIVVCNTQANFTWYRDSGLVSNLYHFTNTSLNLSSTDSIRWSFGDGTFSNAVNPNHVYAQTGQYNVCLRIQKRNANGTLSNCVSEKCYTVVVYPYSTINCNNVTLSFNTATDPLYFNRKTFTAISNSQIYNQTWTITRLPSTAGTASVVLNQFNPTYVFLDSGTYRVCLRATFANNCIKEYCTTITIANIPPTTSVCNLQLYPNPAQSTVTGVVTLSQPLILYAFVYNSMDMLVAQKVQQGGIGINSVTVNIGNLPAGLYRYKLYYGFQNCTSTFMKQ